MVGVGVQPGDRLARGMMGEQELVGKVEVYEGEKNSWICLRMSKMPSSPVRDLSPGALRHVDP